MLNVWWVRCTVSTWQHLQSLQSPIIFSCYYRQLEGSGPGGSETVCSAALHRCSEWLTHHCGGEKNSSELRTTFFFSNWTVLNRLDAISGNGLRSVTQTERSNGSDHTHRYTHLHTTINMYTHIVFESRSISLCKYKCITFQILQHKCW